MSSPRTEWFKSSYSMQNGDCVEARHTTGGMDVRDSKEPAERRIRVSADAWTTFLTTLRDERAM